jgi:hypothetical protein
VLVIPRTGARVAETLCTEAQVQLRRSSKAGARTFILMLTGSAQADCSLLHSFLLVLP